MAPRRIRRRLSLLCVCLMCPAFASGTEATSRPASQPTSRPVCVLTYSDILDMVHRDPENAGRQIDLISDADVVIDKESYLKALRDTVAEIEAGDAQAKWWDITLLARVARRKGIREGRDLLAQAVKNQAIDAKTRYRVAQTVAALCDGPAELLLLVNSQDDATAAGALDVAADSELPEIRARIDSMLAQRMKNGSTSAYVDHVLAEIDKARFFQKLMGECRTEDERVFFLLDLLGFVGDQDTWTPMDPELARTDTVVARRLWGWVVDAYKRDAPRMRAVAAKTAEVYPRMGHLLRLVMAELARLSPSGSTRLQEQFIMARRNGDMNHFARFDPGSDRPVGVESRPRDVGGVVTCFPFLDGRGRPLTVRRREKADAPDDRRLVDIFLPGASQPVSSRPAAESISLREYAILSTSPDGQAAVLWGEGSRLAWAGRNGVRSSLPVDWYVPNPGPFSWSPDCRKVAFYFGMDSTDDDFKIQRHGVAIFSEDGTVQALVEPSESTATPNSISAKMVAPAWGRSGRFIYFTRGFALGLWPGDPQRNLKPAQRYPNSPHSLPAVTCRVDVNTGEVEEIGSGEFACVSPDEGFVLTYPCMRPTEGGADWLALKIDLRTRQVKYLPRLRLPILSPSGETVACLLMKDPKTQEIVFFDTTRWMPFGKRIQLDRIVTYEEWYRYFRWIVPEGTTVESPAAPSTATAPAGT